MLFLSWGKGWEGVGREFQELFFSSCPHDRHKSGEIDYVYTAFPYVLMSFHSVLILPSIDLFTGEEILHR